MYGYEKISKTWTTPYNVENWKVYPLYGGSAILVNNEAGYWIKDKHIYACNGTAMSLSPGIQHSPPSVDQAAIERAVTGQAPPMPPAFNTTYTAFIDSMLKELTGLEFKKSTWSQYEASGVEFHIAETGGMLTKAGMSCLAEKGKMEVPTKTMIAFFGCIDPSLTNMQIAFYWASMLKAAVQDIGSQQISEHSNALITMTASKIDGKTYLELTAVPSKQQ
ncbi:hypothetical protein [Pseudodesulfovibrio sediminis]|nr:hypothetical protein [Pseudodesulfovibrio sediminis]